MFCNDPFKGFHEDVQDNQWWCYKVTLVSKIKNIYRLSVKEKHFQMLVLLNFYSIVIILY